MKSNRRIAPKKNATSFFYKFFISIFLILFVVSIWKFRKNCASFFGIKWNNQNTTLSKDAVKKEKIRITSILEDHDDLAVGFDVSEYQSAIEWSKATQIGESFELSFVFVRATAGASKVDKKFNRNWNHAKKNQLIRGAYHYYRPNENSMEQADNFIKTVQLSRGDLPPVLDIEKLPRTQSLARLKVGLRRWLVKVEQHYKVKPIIYSGERYYLDFLKDEFSDYHLWIANYNSYRSKMEKDWEFWQFTEMGSLNGIKGYVDLNLFNGTKSELESLCR